jgi:hypothetical protein
VIIERLPPIPSKPQSLIIERWLPYAPLKRRVIFQRADAAAAAAAKAKNVIVQWERPTVRVRQEFKDLGVVRANPSEYSARYGATLKRTADLPLFVRDMKPPPGLTLAGQAAVAYELEGDLHALKLIDLESEGTRLTFV